MGQSGEASGLGTRRCFLGLYLRLAHQRSNYLLTCFFFTAHFSGDSQLSVKVKLEFGEFARHLGDPALTLGVGGHRANVAGGHARPQRCIGSGHIMNAHTPGAGVCCQHAHGHARVVSIVKRRVFRKKCRQKAFAGGSDKDRISQRHQFFHAAQHLPIVLRGFGKTQPGVKNQFVARNACLKQCVRPVDELTPDIGGGVLVDGLRVHIKGVSSPVAGDIGHPRRRCRSRHEEICQAARDIVDVLGPTLHSQNCGGRVHGVDAHGHARGGQRRDDGQNTILLLFGSHAFSTGTR